MTRRPAQRCNAGNGAALCRAFRLCRESLLQPRASARSDPRTSSGPWRRPLEAEQGSTTPPLCAGACAGATQSDRSGPFGLAEFRRPSCGISSHMTTTSDGQYPAVAGKFVYRAPRNRRRPAPGGSVGHLRMWGGHDREFRRSARPLADSGGLSCPVSAFVRDARAAAARLRVAASGAAI